MARRAKQAILKASSMQLDAARRSRSKVSGDRCEGGAPQSFRFDPGRLHLTSIVRWTDGLLISVSHTRQSKTICLSRPDFL